MMSYFGRLNYNYKERYLLEANVRYDGSSRLAQTNVGEHSLQFPVHGVSIWKIGST